MIHKLDTIPQTNLYFFNSISLMVVFFWLVGYGVFFRYVVSRILYGYQARAYLSSHNTVRHNPLASLFCPLFVIGDVTYVEGFLFSVEFLLLLFLVVQAFSGLVKLTDSSFLFVHQSSSDDSASTTQRLVSGLTNQLRLTTSNRLSTYLDSGVNKINLYSYSVLELVFQPYNVQPWLTAVFESFFPLLHELAQHYKGELDE